MSVLSRRIGLALRGHGSGIFKVWDDRDAAQRVQVQDRADRLLSRVSNPVLRSVLEHHRPIYEIDAAPPVCLGCDTDDEPEAEPPAWPCSTWRLVEDLLRS